jgi:hypothetical protein
VVVRISCAHLSQGACEYASKQVKDFQAAVPIEDATRRQLGVLS